MPVFHTDQKDRTDQAATAQLLVFTLQGEDYALALTEIREIIPTPDITPVPNMAAAMKGVANLRGRVVTVLDLETHFGLKNDAETKPYIIVAERGSDLFGLLVHEAKEVLRVAVTEQKETPEVLRSHPSADALKGVIVHKDTAVQEKEAAANTQKERLILALDLDKILSHFSSNSKS